MLCASDNVGIVGDFNIDFMDSSDYEYNKSINILDTFDFIQHVNMPTHNSGHLLDYNSTRKDNSLFLSNTIIISDFISDHRAFACLINRSMSSLRP